MNDFKLDKHSKITSGFRIPENYFEKIQVTIQSKLENESSIIQLRPTKNSWAYAVAAILVLALIIPSLNRLTSKKLQNTTAIESYLAYSDISDEELVDMLDLKDIQQINIDYDIENNIIEDVLSTNSNLENYIID